MADVRKLFGVGIALVVVCGASVWGQEQADSLLPPRDAPRRIRAQFVWQDSARGFIYTRPRLLSAFFGVPATLAQTARHTFRAQRIPVLLGVVGATAVLYAGDEPILDETRRFARRVGLPPNHPSYNLRAGPLKQPIPTTIGSGLYFLGDGLTSVAVAAGLTLPGALGDDIRSRRVASEVIEALLASGVVTQIAKHATGRQTPSEATVPRGRWRPFAPLGDYNRNVPGYDAFPSGHLASTTATLTVLALNYPEHRFVWPLGYATMGLLSFAMVNNGVHWASDYPIAVAVGAAVGEVVVNRGRTKVRLPARPGIVPVTVAERPAIDVVPLIEPSAIGLRLRFR